MFERFTDRAVRVVVLAQEEARLLDHDYIGTEHILLGLIHEGEGAGPKTLEALGIRLGALRQEVEKVIGRGQQAPSGHIPFTPRAKKALELSLREALQLGNPYIGTQHILLGLIREREGIAAQVLVANGAESNKVHQTLVRLPLVPGDDRNRDLEDSAVLAASFAPPSPLVLDRFGRNLTQRAYEGRLDLVIGREKEIERVMQVLSRRTQNSPVLVGPPGVGKTAIVAGLAHKIVQGRVPRGLVGKQIYALDPSVDVSGSQAEILKEIQTSGDIVVFLDRLPAPVTDGVAQHPSDLASVLRPLLARGELQVIGEMTSDEYRDYLARDPAAERRFQPIQVAEPTVSLTVEMLKGIVRDRYEDHHRVTITDQAMVTAAELADKHLPGRRLPGKAIDLIDEAASLAEIRGVTVSADLREYNEKIAQVRREKESYIDSQDFEKAADKRYTEKQLLAKKAAVEKEWKAGEMEVTEQIIAEALATMTGLSSERLTSDQSSQAQAPPFPSAAMTDDDREIWAMS